MPIGDPGDGFFYPTLTHMMDSYNLIPIFVICFSAEKDYDIMLKSKVKEGGQKVNTFITVKPVLSDHSKRRSKLVFKTNYCLMQVKSTSECSRGSILQYFWPSLRYSLSLRHLFCLFLSGSLRQVLLYIHTVESRWFKFFLGTRGLFLF